MGLFISLIKVSLRNIFRNKRRSISTIVILILGNVGLILVGGFFDNLILDFREQFIYSQVGHLQVNARGFFEKGTIEPYQYMVKNYKDIQSIIENDPRVRLTIPRIRLTGLASSNKSPSSAAVLAVGTDAALESKMGASNKFKERGASVKILSGHDLKTDNPFGALLGKGLAKSLGLTVGDSFQFITNTEAGSIDGATFTLVGIFETVVKDYDDRAMRINLEAAKGLIQNKDQVHSLTVLLNHTEETDGVKQALEKQFSEKGFSIEVIPWEDYALYYRQSRDFLRKVYLAIQIIIGVIFLMSIANTINMTISERTREYGTMMAMGNDRAIIFSVIFLEATFLGLIGSTIGITIGIVASKIISSIGIVMPPPPQGTSEYIALISLSPALVLMAGLTSFTATLASAIIPAIRASRMKIIGALGYV